MNTAKENRQKNYPHAARKKPLKKKQCCGAHPIISSKGELVITAKRSSFNLPYDLPYGIWGLLYLQQLNYQPPLQAYLPAGITFTNSVDPLTGNVIFDYTDGKTNDTITLSTTGDGLVSYAELVNNLNSNFMRSNYSIFNCNAAYNATTLLNSDINYLADLPLIPTTIDALKVQGGERRLNVIIPRSRQTPQNSMLQTFEIYLRKEPIKPETLWIHKVGYTPTLASSLPQNTGLQFAFLIIINERIDVNENSHQVFEKSKIRN